MWLEIRSPVLVISGENHLNAQKFIFLRRTHLLLNYQPSETLCQLDGIVLDEIPCKQICLWTELSIKT